MNALFKYFDLNERTRPTTISSAEETNFWGNEKGSVPFDAHPHEDEVNHKEKSTTFFGDEGKDHYHERRENSEFSYERGLSNGIKTTKKHPMQSARLTEQHRPISLCEQLSLYIGTLVGVLFSSYVSHFKDDKIKNLGITLSSLSIAAIIALVIIPVAYEKINVRRDAPFIVRFALFVQHGVFWQVLLGFIGKTIV